MKINKNKSKIIIICIIILLIASLIFTAEKLYKTKLDIEESITEEGIENEEIKEAVIKERQRIKKDEYLKIGITEAILIVIGVGTITCITVKSKANNRHMGLF